MSSWKSGERNFSFCWALRRTRWAEYRAWISAFFPNVSRSTMMLRSFSLRVLTGGEGAERDYERNRERLNWIVLAGIDQGVVRIFAGLDDDTRKVLELVLDIGAFQDGAHGGNFT